MTLGEGAGDVRARPGTPYARYPRLTGGVAAARGAVGRFAAMDLTLTDEEREIRDWVRTFVTRELMPLEPQVLERERNGERGLTLDELRGAPGARPSSRGSSASRRPRSTAGWGSAR